VPRAAPLWEARSPRRGPNPSHCYFRPFTAHFPLACHPRTQVCVPKPSRANSNKCVPKVLLAGNAAVSCPAGSGLIGVEFTSAKTSLSGFSVGRAHTVLASCANSPPNVKSSCGLANGNGTVVAPTLTGGVSVSSPEWDGNCVCKATGRRPVLLIRTAEVVAGAGCFP
jgi:hypothetical protein